MCCASVSRHDSAVLDWMKRQREHDQVARRTFVGDDCRLCSEPGWTVHRKNIT